MARSKSKGGKARRGGASRGGGAGAGTRLQTLGLFLTLLAVAALVGSLAWGIWDHFRDRPGASAGPATPSADSARLAGPPPAGRVKVEVLNAGGVPGQAKRATDVLRDRGFDVVTMGNAPRGTDPNVSVVYDRVGRLDAARGVAQALAIARSETRRDPGPLVDVTVVLGRDWKAP